MTTNPDLPCSACGVLMWRASTSLPAGEAKCRACRKLANTFTCQQCSVVFVRKATSAPGKFCSRQCLGESRRGRDMELQAERYRRKNRKRRNVLSGVTSESYTRNQIAQRDGFQCGICHTAVDMSIRWPDAKSPTIDHVHPLILGGHDTRANVQLAHMGCNSRKSGRAQVRT